MDNNAFAVFYIETVINLAIFSTVLSREIGIKLWFILYRRGTKFWPDIAYRHLFVFLATQWICICGYWTVEVRYLELSWTVKAYARNFHILENDRKDKTWKFILRCLHKYMLNLEFEISKSEMYRFSCTGTGMWHALVVRSKEQGSH